MCTNYRKLKRTKTKNEDLEKQIVVIKYKLINPRICYVYSRVKQCSILMMHYKLETLTTKLTYIELNQIQHASSNTQLHAGSQLNVIQYLFTALCILIPRCWHPNSSREIYSVAKRWNRWFSSREKVGASSLNSSISSCKTFKSDAYPKILRSTLTYLAKAMFIHTCAYVVDDVSYKTKLT